MLAAVVGGGLQGIEAAYLAIKAGWQVMIIDKNPAAPAARLGHIFLHEDVTQRCDLERLLPGVELVIPALENDAALAAVKTCCERCGIPFAYDPAAYAVSSSKIESDRLFARLQIPAPRPWPEAGFPLIAKPDKGSGSQGVKIIRDSIELQSCCPRPEAVHGWVLQEYVAGPSFSLEIIGYPGAYRTLQVTDLEMDAIFDCKRVLAPTRLDQRQIERFSGIAVQLAESISLTGIMDVEAILNDGELKVLEIDARLPSQTPIAVYWSTGFNMVEALGRVFNISGASQVTNIGLEQQRGVVLEHILVSENRLEVLGEHIMKSASALRLIPDFFGADEAITDYEPMKDRWVASLIVSGNDREEAWDRRNQVIKDIKQLCKLEGSFY